MIKRGLILGFVLLLVSCLTLYFTIDLDSLKALSTFNIESLLFALLTLTIGMYFDGKRLQRLVRIGGYHLPIKAVLRVIFSNYFMAMLTPGASGGAVAQVLTLRSYGLPMAKGTPIVLIRTVFSIMFLICMLPFIFLYDDISIPYISKSLLLTVSICAVGAVFIGIYVFQTDVFKKFIFWIANKSEKGNPKSWLVKLDELNSGFSLLYTKPIQSVIVFIESGLSLLFLYSIVPALMWAFTTHIPIIEVLNRMILLNLVLYFAPTPGGTGVAEGLFVIFFSSFVPNGTVGLVAVSWRVVAEYVPFFIGMYAVLTLYGRQFVAGSIKDKK